MGLFTKTIEKPVYVDTLQDWRNVVVGDYKMLDRVWILRTIDQSKRSHPHHTYKKEIDYTAQEGIIIGTATGWFYSDTPVGEQIDHEGWEYRYEDGSIMECEGHIKYRYNNGYTVLLRDGTHVDAHTVKKSHGEFQEEFEHLQEIEKKKIEILANQERYRESLEGMEELLEKGRNLQNRMTEELIKATLPTKK